MQIQVDALITFSRPPSAANEDFEPVSSPAEQVAAGWDAYEVWRTRIKAVQARHRTPQTG
jgi:hypothetical protein